MVYNKNLFENIHQFGKPRSALDFASYSWKTVNRCAMLHAVPLAISENQPDDWLIFCCGIFILHQKRNENDKNTHFMMKKVDESIA